MIRLALPKGRNLETALAAFAAGGLDLSGLDSAAARDSRRLWHVFPELGLEVLLLKDRDLPLYVGPGTADRGHRRREQLVRAVAGEHAFGHPVVGRGLERGQRFEF